MDEERLKTLISNNIKKYRTDKLSLKELAQKTDLSINYLKKIENKELLVTIDSLYKIATILELPISKLLEE